ncbi:MAG TPA: nucleotidyltransferase [Solirubrobacteraceae bacterium]|nr:nucleotidyltransferase [Solirubrobacteraceae bacterium]
MDDAIVATMRRVVAALRDADVPYLLGGGFACWARGGPFSEHDLDVMVKPQDAVRAQRALAEAGMRTEDPPEEWLLKAYDGDVLVDLIFEPQGLPMTDEVIERGDELTVEAITARVMALEDVIATKLLVLDEHECDFAALIAIARALREQIDWAEVRQRTAGSPFAQAFFVIAEGLGLLESLAVG